MAKNDGQVESKPQRIRAKDCQKLLGVCKASTYRLLQGEEKNGGVYRIFNPGSSRPMIVVDPEVIERILRRASSQL